MMRRGIKFGAADLGTKNFGFGCGILYGTVALTNDAGETVETIPNFDPICMQRCDLKSGTVTTHSADFQRHIAHIGGAKQPFTKSQRDMSVRLGQCLGAAHCLHEPHPSLLEPEGAPDALPIFVTELQPGAVLTDYHQKEMEQLSHICMASVQAIDASKDQQRLNCQGALKYGMRNDASLSYSERKKYGVQVMKELLHKLGHKQWYDWMVHMEALGEKMDDMCDAFLLGLQKALNLYEQCVKDQIKEQRALLKSIPKVPTKPRAKKAVATGVATVTVTNVTPTFIDLGDDDVSLSEADKVVLPPKKRAVVNRKIPVDDDGDNKKKRKRKPVDAERPVKKRKQTTPAPKKGSIFAKAEAT